MAQLRRRSGGTPAGAARRAGHNGVAATGDRADDRAADRAAQRRDLAATRARVRDVVEPVLTRRGYDLEELAVSRVGRRHLVRVVVDGDDVGPDAIAEVSRAVSEALDAAEESGGEILTGEYQLEVSSPGVDRPLTEPRHWRRNVGRLVKVGTGGRTVTGRVTEAGDAGVVLDVAGAPESVPYDRLGPGRVQIEFSRLDDLSDDDLHPIDDEEGDEEE